MDSIGLEYLTEAIELNVVKLHLGSREVEDRSSHR